MAVAVGLAARLCADLCDLRVSEGADGCAEWWATVTDRGVGLAVTEWMGAAGSWVTVGRGVGDVVCGQIVE